jgi:hypothetical protein
MSATARDACADPARARHSLKKETSRSPGGGDLQQALSAIRLVGPACDQFAPLLEMIGRDSTGSHIPAESIDSQNAVHSSYLQWCSLFQLDAQSQY